MEWTKSQEKAINLRGKNILVAAAAGSGKTAVLVSRIKKLVIEENESIDRMLIVTFTNAAASEMREKIENALKDAANDSANNNASYIKRQLDLLPNANISTFHAFSLEVIHRYFYLIDLEPNFKICDQVRATLLKEDAMNELMETLYEENSPEFYSFLDRYSGERNDSKFRDTIDNIYRTISSLPDPLEWLDSASKDVEERFLDDAKFVNDSVHRYDEIYSRLKMEKKLLDFSDIEHLAYKILKNEEAANYYKEKFNHIFIDEYQDSNIIQEELISMISRDNNLFTVGDVKQSIYRFRLAEPEIFESRYKRYAEGEEKSEKIDLNQNFRSKKPIIDFINYIFSSLLEGYDENAELKLGAVNGDKSEFEPKLYLTTVPWNEEIDIDDELKNLKKTEKEALACVKIIKEHLGKEFYDGEKLRKLEKRDIVILMRAIKGYGDIYYRVLMDNDIPTFVDDSEGYFDTLEINTMLELLRLIDNEKQDIPLLSVLRSEIFKFSIDELVKIRINYKEGMYYDALKYYANDGSDEALRKKVVDTFEKLKMWQKDALSMKLDELILKLELETGFYIYVGTLPSGGLRQANLRALIDRALSYSDGQGGSLYGFIRYIDAVKKQKVASPQVKLIGENEDTVRIMTIHKSKGLEFPMVILANYAKNLNYSKIGNGILIHKEVGLGFPDVSYEEKWIQATEKQNEIKTKIKEEEAEEEKRILYVAMTRAKDILCLLGIVNDIDKEIETVREKGHSSKSYLAMTLGYILDKDSVKVIDDKELNEIKHIRKRSAKVVLDAIDSIKDNNIDLEVQNQMSFIYPYEKDMNTKSKYSVSELNMLNSEAEDANDQRRTDDGKMTWKAKKKASGKFSASEIGTFTHTALEHMSFSLAISEGMGHIDKLMKSLVADEILLLSEADAVNKEKLLEFANTNLGNRIAKAEEIGELYREKPFNMEVEVNGVTTIAQGVIDCYFRENGKWILVDYKTTNPYNIDGVKDRYQKQIDMYREALSEATGIEVSEAYLYLTNIGMEVKM